MLVRIINYGAGCDSVVNGPNEPNTHFFFLNRWPNALLDCRGLTPDCVKKEIRKAKSLTALFGSKRNLA